MRLYIYPTNTSIGFPWAPSENWGAVQRRSSSFCYFLLSCCCGSWREHWRLVFLWFSQRWSCRWNQMDMQRSASSERRAWDLFCVLVYIDGLHSMGMEIAFTEELLDGRHREGRAARIKATSSRLWQALGHVLWKLSFAQQRVRLLRSHSSREHLSFYKQNTVKQHTADVKIQ